MIRILLCFLAISVAAEDAKLNELSPEEQRAGWRLLFDGTSAKGWRAFNKQTFPEKGWAVAEGCLKKLAKVPGGDIVTEAVFDDFELQWDWKVATNGNNGVKYFISEERNSPIGHEYQLVDDVGHPDGRRGPKRQTASFYDVLPPAAGKPLNPPGQWNHSRILVQGDHVEHWLNGAKVLAYECGSDELKAAVANSKFKTVPGFGAKRKGLILLTDHQDECWFRNVKVRDLPAK